MKTWIITVRDPDYSNDYTVIDGDEPGVEIVDIDLGRMCPEEYDAQWKADIVGLAPLGSEVRKRLREILMEVV